MQNSIDRHGKGYDWANHEVHTDDGYILNIFRLLPPGFDSDDENHIWGDPVFLQHGMGANGSRFINRLEDQDDEFDALAISLAKEGYDVWIGNNRGNQFSSLHEKLDWSEDEADYWAYSFPELA